MCTAAVYKTKDSYFGRNLDLEFSYGEAVTVTPGRFPFAFRSVGAMRSHHAMIGMAHISAGYPLYYDAVNEKGLAMAGLNFPESARYRAAEEGMDNIAPFEVIPWVLSQCGNVDEARELAEKMNVTQTDFSPELPATPLHWIVSDGERSLVLEPTEEGLKIYDNPVGILTNEPEFEFHLTNLKNYMNLSPEPAENRFSDGLDMEPYSRGMGALGLPGDLSSASRFVRAAFTRLNSLSGDGEGESVSQFFHILGSAAQQRGCVRLGPGKYEKTVYSSCCNLSRGIYYYTTYENSAVTAVDMHREDISGTELRAYPLETRWQVRFLN